MVQPWPRIADEQKSQKVQCQLRDALFEANESGKMDKILEETLGSFWDLGGGCGKD